MVTFTITEHTSRFDLLDLLKTTLGPDFYVFQKLTLKEERLTPDIVILKKNSTKIYWKKKDKIRSHEIETQIQCTQLDTVLAVIETKQEGTTKLEQYEKQLSRYCRATRCSLGFLREGKNLIAYDYQTGKQQYYEVDTINEITRVITECIEEKTNITLAKKPEEILKILENHIEQLFPYIDSVVQTRSLSSDFKEENSLLPRNAIEELGEDFIKRTIAYIGIVQLLFYSVYRMYLREKGISNDKLKPLVSSHGVPVNIQKILDGIPDNINFQSIYEQNVYSYLDESASADLLEIICSLEGISNKYLITHQLMGQIFQRLMPFEKRKIVAAYYTKPESAELLTKLSITKEDQIVYDPACGSGELLTAAYRQKRALGLRKHEEILNQIKGTDISDIACVMSTVNLAIQNPSYLVKTISICRTDFFRLSHNLESLLESNTHNGYSNTGEKQFVKIYERLKEGVDVILANPPFTKGKRLSEETRGQLKHLLTLTKIKEFKPNFGTASLFPFFLLFAPQFIKKNGTLAFILPLSSIKSKYMIPVWSYLLEDLGFGVKYLIEASDIERSFSESSEHEIIILIQKGYSKMAKVCKLRNSLDSLEIEQVISEINNCDLSFERTEHCILQNLDQKYFRDIDCIRWKTYPSQYLDLFYRHFVPLNNEKYTSRVDQEESNDDLSTVVTLVTENASRPVDYWFIPNKFWSLEYVDDKKLVVKAKAKNKIITSDEQREQELELPRSNFVSALSRKSGFYDDFPPIIPKYETNQYFLKSELGKELSDWLKWRDEAIKRDLFGTKTFQSVSYKANKIGIRKKIAFKKCLAFRFKEPMMGSQIIRFGFTGEERVMDLFFAYLSSSIFLLDALEKRKSRAGAYSIINQFAILEVYRFPNLKKLMKNSKSLVDKLIEASTKFNSTSTIGDRPNLLGLIKSARRDENHNLRNLDALWFEIYNIPMSMLDLLYEDIEERLSDFEK